MAAPNLCQLLDPRKGRSLMQINTALQRMGFATWSDLEPGKFSFWCSIFQLFRNKIVEIVPFLINHIQF